MLECRDLRYRHSGGDHTIGADFSLEAGQGVALMGPSGVGKSALINAIHPQLNLRVGNLRNFEGKGRHTTRNAQLFRLPLGAATYIADTPGIRELGLYELDPGSLGFYFVDLKPFVNDCHFPNCTHDHEPECAVRQAAVEGKVSPQRYDSYVRLLNGESFQLEEW